MSSATCPDPEWLLKHTCFVLTQNQLLLTDCTLRVHMLRMGGSCLLISIYVLISTADRRMYMCLSSTGTENKNKTKQPQPQTRKIRMVQDLYLKYGYHINSFLEKVRLDMGFQPIKTQLLRHGSFLDHLQYLWIRPQQEYKAMPWFWFPTVKTSIFGVL